MATEVFSVRTDTRIVRQLDKLARQQDRSGDYIVNEAIKNYLDLHVWQAGRIRAGIEAADQGRFSGRVELERVFGKFE